MHDYQHRAHLFDEDVCVSYPFSYISWMGVGVRLLEFGPIHPPNAWAR